MTGSARGPPKTATKSEADSGTPISDAITRSAGMYFRGIAPSVPPFDAGLRQRYGAV